MSNIRTVPVSSTLYAADVVNLLRAPVSLKRLYRDGEWLMTSDGERYEIEAGIPILFPEPHNRPRGVKGSEPLSSGTLSAAPLDQSRSTESDIIASFRDRAGTYFSDNYSRGLNPPRERRQRLVVSLIQEHFPRGGKVLEAGAGPAALGSVLREITPGYVALDLSLANLVEGCRRLGQIHCVCGSITALPFADESFDAIAAIGCLEYIPRLETALAELSRVAKVGAPLILSIANRASPARWWDEIVVNPIVRLRAASGRRPSYKRALISRARLESLLNSVGASVDEVHFLNQGLVGYPLSATALANRLWSATVSHAPRVSALSSEIVVLARGSS